jgi:hypothetical protein
MHAAHRFARFLLCRMMAGDLRFLLNREIQILLFLAALKFCTIGLLAHTFSFPVTADDDQQSNVVVD